MKALASIIATIIMAVNVYAGDIPAIETEQLQEVVKSKKVVLLDANGTKTYLKGHIPGAIDCEANKEKLSELLPKEKDALIVAYCGGPLCRAYKEPATEAKKLGYTNVKHFPPGISGWKKAGLETETGGS